MWRKMMRERRMRRRRRRKGYSQVRSRSRFL
jgi:hypothetical protein